MRKAEGTASSPLGYGAAVEIAEGFSPRFPKLDFDGGAVLFAADMHDLEEVLHPIELTGPGSGHEDVGPGLLERHGISSQFARFARTHWEWSRETLPLEDALVALADCVWKASG